MLKNSSRETLMRKNINKTGEIGKSERRASLVLFSLFGFSYFFAGFPGGYCKNVTAEQGFRFVFLRLSGSYHCRCVSVWCGAVCCAVVSGDDASMCPGSVNQTGSRPGSLQVLVLVWSDPGLRACLCWRPVKGQRPQAGSISDGWKGWNSRKKINEIKTQLVEHVCQINETNTNKTSRTFITTQTCLCFFLPLSLTFEAQ